MGLGLCLNDMVLGNIEILTAKAPVNQNYHIKAIPILEYLWNDIQ